MSSPNSVPPGIIICALAAILLTTGFTAVANTLEVADSLDRRVILAEPAQRVITLAPHLVENLYSAGGG